MDSTFKKRRLLVFFDFVLYRQNSNYLIEDSHILFINAVQTVFNKTILFSRLINSGQKKGLEIPTGISIQALPYYKNLPDLLYRKPYLLLKIVQLFKKQIQPTDILWLAWPHPISYLLLRFFGKKIPLFLSVRENLTDVVTEKYHGISRYLGLFMVKQLNLYLKKNHANVPIFITGREMYDTYKENFHNSVQIKSTLLTTTQSNLKKQKSLNGSTKLLYVGRLEKVKGLTYLIDAIDIISKTQQNIHLDIVGTGIELRTLNKQVISKKLEDYVQFSGYVPYGDELNEHYQTADIFVLPTLTEGFPKVIDEARSFFLPIITTQSGGIEEELTDGESAIMVKKKSATNLAKAIFKLINNPSLRNKLSENARLDNQDSIQHFSRKIISELETHFK